MENSSTYHELKITYGELELALKKLGFERRVNKKENALIFENNKEDSFVILSKKRRNALVFPPVFASTIHQLELQGLIEFKGDLPEMIMKERLRNPRRNYKYQ